MWSPPLCHALSRSSLARSKFVFSVFQIGQSSSSASKSAAVFMTETVRIRFGESVERRKVLFKIIIKTFIIIYFSKKVLFVSVGEKKQKKGESQDSEGKWYKHLI